MVDIDLLVKGDLVKVIDKKSKKSSLGEVLLKNDSGVLLRIGFDDDLAVRTDDDRFYIECCLEKV